MAAVLRSPAHDTTLASPTSPWRSFFTDASRTVWERRGRSFGFHRSTPSSSVSTSSSLLSLYPTSTRATVSTAPPPSSTVTRAPRFLSAVGAVSRAEEVEEVDAAVLEDAQRTRNRGSSSAQETHSSSILHHLLPSRPHRHRPERVASSLPKRRAPHPSSVVTTTRRKKKKKTTRWASFLSLWSIRLPSSSSARGVGTMVRPDCRMNWFLLRHAGGVFLSYLLTPRSHWRKKSTCLPRSATTSPLTRTASRRRMTQPRRTPEGTPRSAHGVTASPCVASRPRSPLPRLSPVSPASRTSSAVASFSSPNRRSEWGCTPPEERKKPKKKVEWARSLTRETTKGHQSGRRIPSEKRVPSWKGDRGEYDGRSETSRAIHGQSFSSRFPARYGKEERFLSRVWSVLLTWMWWIILPCLAPVSFLFHVLPMMVVGGKDRGKRCASVRKRPFQGKKDFLPPLLKGFSFSAFSSASHGSSTSNTAHFTATTPPAPNTPPSPRPSSSDQEAATQATTTMSSPPSPLLSSSPSTSGVFIPQQHAHSPLSSQRYFLPISVPVLFVYGGGKSSMLHSRQWSEYIETKGLLDGGLSRVVCIEGGGHWFFAEPAHREEVADEVEAFLSS